MSTTTIRPARAAESAIIRTIVRAAHLNPINLHWERFLVAEEAGRIIGVGQVRIHRAGSRELASLAVLPEAQGRGIGRALTQALLAREHGPIFLFCAEPTAQFYVRFGFAVAPASETPPDLRLLQMGAGVISAIGALSGKPRVVMMLRG
jgi:N-acetylglutamate synthase-like GNAT family acetyltransferase